MPDIPFPLGLSGSEDLPKTRTVLKNCFNNGQAVLPMPGITQQSTAPGVARGQFEYNDRLYQASSQQLVRVDTTTGTSTVIGAIAGTERIVFAAGDSHGCIVVKGGNAYTLTTAEVLTQITDTDYVASDYVTNMDGRFIFTPSDGSPIFFSDVSNAASIQSLSFFDAEQLPDKNKVAFNYNNLLYVGGTDSFEIFRHTGSGTVPYTRLQGRIEYGYIGGLLNYANSYIFIGNEKDLSAGIYLIGQGVANKMSNETIDLILAKYTEKQLAEVITNRFKWRGHEIATFALQFDSFAYFNGQWFVIDTRVDGENSVWQAGFITELNGNYYTAYSNKNGILAKSNKDYGVASEKEIVIPFIHPEDGEFTLQSIELDISQGYNATAGTVGLSMSQDGVLFGPMFFREVAAQGQYANKLVWNYPGGLGYYRGFAAMRFTTSDDVYFAANKLTVNIR